MREGGVRQGAGQCEAAAASCASRGGGLAGKPRSPPQPAFKSSTPPVPAQPLQVLLASPAFRAAFAGHDHVGGYACIEGRHFLTLQGLLEAPSDGTAYAVVHVHADRLRIEGHGTVPNRELPV